MLRSNFSDRSTHANGMREGSGGNIQPNHVVVSSTTTWPLPCRRHYEEINVCPQASDRSQLCLQSKHQRTGCNVVEYVARSSRPFDDRLKNLKWICSYGAYWSAETARWADWCLRFFVPRMRRRRFMLLVESPHAKAFRMAIQGSSVLKYSMHRIYIVMSLGTVSTVQSKVEGPD